MGFLLIDHSGGQGIDGEAGRKQEYDTEQCKHCGAVIAVLSRPLGQKEYLSSVDVARDTQKAGTRGENYVGKRRCCKCRGNLCKACHSQQPRCVTLTQQMDLIHALADRVRSGVPLDEALKEGV